jgi:hypothetical protein
MTELKCDKCAGTRLTLLSSKIEGLDRLIDIYFCRGCQHSKIVTTLKDNKPDIQDVHIPDEEPFIEILDEPQNPYEDNDDGGWDPNIG